MATDEQAIGTRPSWFSLLIGIFVRPRQTFELIREHGGSGWLLTAVFIIILTALPTIVAGPILQERARQEFLEVQEQFDPPPEFADQGVPDAIGSPLITVALPAVGSVFAVILAGWLIWSGAVHLLSMMSGGRNTFLQLLQTAVWAWLPYSLRDLIQTIYILVTGTIIENQGLSGFAPVDQADIFTQPEPSQLALNQLLGYIDIYLFWNLALLVLGISIMAQFSRRKSFGIVLIIWSLFTLLSLLPSLLIGGIAG
ncbi:MAG: Yip1 family protein [Chloroflexota bacterium]